MKILMGTKNPGKIEGAKQAFQMYFQNVQIEGISVNSEVGVQPFNEEILTGAKNRVKNVKKFAKQKGLYADFYIASEAGITNQLSQEWIDINAAVIESEAGIQSVGISQGFQIPYQYRKEITQTELGKLFDRLFTKTQLSKGKGGISVLTHEQITRIDLTRNAFVMALISHINGDIWK